LAYQKLKPEYDTNFNCIESSDVNNKRLVDMNKTETTSSSEDNDPILKLTRIKNEIDLIEKDLRFYTENV